MLLILILASQQVAAAGFGDYPALPGMAAGGVPQPNSLYPPLAGIAPMTANPTSVYPPAQSAMRGMPNSLFSMFQSQSNQPQNEGSRSGWPQPPQQTPYGTQGHSTLEGMWQGSNGEMIAIKENRFLYSDKGTQKFSGYLSIGRDRFQATIPSSKTVASYEYWLKENKLTVRDEAGRVLYFQRVYR